MLPTAYYDRHEVSYGSMPCVQLSRFFVLLSLSLAAGMTTNTGTKPAADVPVLFLACAVAIYYTINRYIPQ